MNVTLRSDDSPDIRIESTEFCDLAKLEQHIRTLQIARAWLIREWRIKREKEKQQRVTPVGSK